MNNKTEFQTMTERQEKIDANKIGVTVEELRIIREEEEQEAQHRKEIEEQAEAEAEEIEELEEPDEDEEEDSLLSMQFGYLKTEYVF